MTKLDEGSEAIRQALRSMPLGCFANDRESDICKSGPCECCDVAFRASIKALIEAVPAARAYLQAILDEESETV